MASEEILFKNVDDEGPTEDACLYYKLTYETLAQVSWKWPVRPAKT